MALSVGDAAHLLRRTGFGVTPAALAEMRGYPSRQAAVARALDLSRVPAVSPAPAISFPMGSGYHTSFSNLLVQWWLERMRTTPVPIVEKMALFWHSHFASSFEKVDDASLMVEQNQLFRDRGMGSFHDLVQSVSVNPAMLIYLDNFANVKAEPQENFARELMEVFTLGPGFRDEHDVAGMARAWTGHGLSTDMRRYQFHASEHDTGQKALFGLPPKNWNGPATISEITRGVKAEQSSRYIAAKVFSFFAYPVTVDDPVVHRLAAGFRQRDLSITALLRSVFLSEEFWSPQARHALVRSPVEWVVAGLQAINQGPAFGMEIEQMPNMGQHLFRPGSVAGWGTNGYWVSTAATWAKAAYALQMRNVAQMTGVLSDVVALSPRDAANRGFQQLGIIDPTVRTRAVVERWIQRSRDDGDGTIVPRNLVHLLVMSPEFQVA